MSRYWSELAASLVPYVPGEQPKDKKYIKLNTNENPYPPSPAVLEALRGAAGGDLRLYPDPSSTALTETIAEYYRLPPASVFVGNGSDEILAFAFAALFRTSEPVYYPDITYSFYPVYASLYGLESVKVPLTDDFDVPIESFYNVDGGIIIPNPNAPTSKYVALEGIRSILEHNPDRVVVVDEAYIDFGGESAVKLIHDFPNLLVVQTLSKSRSLAGLRVGFALGHPDLIDGLNRVKNSFNSYTIDRLASAGAVAALKDEIYFQQCCRNVIATRERIAGQLRELGFDVPESKANFLFIAHPDKPAEELFRKLRDKGILVRYFNKPRIDNRLRVSIGTDEEMDAFVAALRELTVAAAAGKDSN
ncbi:histidinol-phosphate transaminase [Paenibacillus beijingensis]|uniref:Histidinol-phosphate aminotransferase n=1 Tax=Paenibacillus beijingensis TaxID=1126833 RepID=A0A0D5NN21_9BACL|nr:histidinol-phosphate transaminase [Paenibacillus beijingensis]AJY76651.1 histidinol-phosphate aminotransferase [Paenibacillus beijingensis]